VQTGNNWAAVALELVRQQERDWRQAWLEERDRRIALEQRVTQLEQQLQETGKPSGQNGTKPSTASNAQEVPAAAHIYRGSAARCGYAGGGSPLKLKPFWDYNDDFTMYLASPLVVGDAVYGASCVLDPPSNYGAVFCLDAATGEERWYTDVFDAPATGRERELKAFFSSPAVTADGKYLVIGQGLHLDDDCELICLDTKSGEVRWVVPTPLHIEGSPAIEGDIVVAGAGAVEGEEQRPKGDPGFVFAVRISDGTLLWKHPLNDPESSPVVHQGIAYIGSGLNGNAVVALRTATDEQLAAEGLERVVWRTETPYPAVGAVTLADDVVLIGCGNANYVFLSPDPKGVVLALDRKTGEVLWQTDVSNSVLGAIAARQGKAVCAVVGGDIVAIDLRNSGRILWRAPVRERSLLKAGPALTKHHAYALTHDGYLCVLDVDDGTLVEQHYVNAPDKPGEMGLSVSSPFVAGGRLYVGSETGGLRCFVGEEVR
jgi:outer membrane protein assembly factor BamB